MDKKEINYLRNNFGLPLTTSEYLFNIFYLN